VKECSAFKTVVFLALIAVPLLVLFYSTANAAVPRFEVHIIERNSSLVNDSVMSCTLSDLDGDGDLDWTIGTIWPKKPRKRLLYWYEYRNPDNWVRHLLGEAPEMYGGACATDVDGNGHVDVVATHLWLNNRKGSQWSFHKTGIPAGVHDMQAVDINMDDRTDFLVFDQAEGLMWFDAPVDPAVPWTPHSIGPSDYAGAKVHATGSPEGADDLDGDGDVDIAAVKGWFENVDGKGLQWLYRRNDLFPVGKKAEFPWGYAVKTVVRDLDGDGDMDIVQSSCDSREPTGIAWLENVDGKGDFKLHWIKQRVAEDYHTLAVIDYDNDGDWDLFSGVGPLSARKKQAYLFENLNNGSRQTIQWKEHVIHSGMTVHEGITGDVDGDGDADIVIKPWNRKDNPKDFLYLENLSL